MAEAGGLMSLGENPIPTPTPIDDRTIQLDHFIPKTQVDPRYLNTPHYIVPTQDIGQEAFAVIRDAMRNKDVVGIGRVVLARRERPLILEPMGDVIRGTTLRYKHEIRDATDLFALIPRLKLPAEMMQIAQHIIQAKTTDFDLAFLEDRYLTVLIEKLEKKHAEMPRSDGMAKPSAQSVIRLMEVLKRSLAAEWPTRPPAGRVTARRGMAARSKPPGKQAGGSRIRKRG
jgi:DNA end-binding protein Ku